MVNIFEFSNVKEIVESWLFYVNKFSCLSFSKKKFSIFWMLKHFKAFNDYGTEALNMAYQI